MVYLYFVSKKTPTKSLKKFSLLNIFFLYVWFSPWKATILSTCWNLKSNKQIHKMKFVNHKANFVSLEIVSKSRNPRINQLLKFPSTSQIVKSFQKDKGLLRSTLIVELMKAYDSIEWKFMISCLLAIGAPKVCALHRSVYKFFQVFNRLVYLESVYFNKTENFLFKIL